MAPQYDRNELVVDTRQKDVVITALANHGLLSPNAGPTVAESVELDLTLLGRLNQSKLSEFARGVRANHPNETAALTPEGSEFTELDALLFGLRREFAERGFVPTMGKNRDTVLGYPKHKAALPPKPISVLGTIPSGGDGSGLVAGVVDTPLAPHDLLPDALVSGDYLTDADLRRSTDFAGHATFVTGLIRQQAPGATVKVRAGLDPESGEATSWHAAVKIVELYREDIAVLNLSFGCVTTDGQPPLVLSRAVERLPDGVLVIAAAGNRNQSNDDWPVPPAEIWPAACSDVVAVGAERVLNENGTNLAGFSMERAWVDCVAAGYQVRSIHPYGKASSPNDDDPKAWAKWSGTSFSAAIVTGKVVAAMSRDRNLSARQTWENLLTKKDSGVRRYEPLRGDHA